MKRALGPPVRGEALSAMLEEWSQEEGRNWVEDAWEDPAEDELIFCVDRARGVGNEKPSRQ
jgi:hypothetical protein